MANFININDSALQINEPQPFQHFTGDYSWAVTPIATSTPGNKEACDRACTTNSNCEFWKYNSTNGLCELFSAAGTQQSGIKINRSLRMSTGTSIIHSDTIPQSFPDLSKSSTQNSLIDCENLCNDDSTCGVYSYSTEQRYCSIYPIGNSGSGFVSVRRDLSTGGTPGNSLGTFSVTSVTSSSITLSNFTGSTVLDSDIIVFSISPVPSLGATLPTNVFFRDIKNGGYVINIPESSIAKGVTYTLRLRAMRTTVTSSSATFTRSTPSLTPPTGLQNWYRARTGLTASAWTDNSGSSRNLSGTSASIADGVSFTGTNMFSGTGFPTTTSTTLVCALKTTRSINSWFGAILASNGNWDPGSVHIQSFDDGTTLAVSIHNADSRFSSIFTINTIIILSVTISVDASNNATVTIYVNGSQVGVNTVNVSQRNINLTNINIGNWSVGRDRPFNGNIYEMLLFNRVLSPQELTNINTYLGDVYINP